MSFLLEPPVMRRANAPVEEQMQSAFSYMYKMAEALNYALNNIDFENLSESVQKDIAAAGGEAVDKKIEASASENLKQLILKTADIVEKESERIRLELQEKYLAISDYGEYREEDLAKLEATAKAIEQRYKSLETITNGISSYINETSACIRTGYLYTDENGTKRYGVGVGENFSKIEDGQVVDKREYMATFVSNKLTFWQNGEEVAYFSNQKLYITNLEVLGNIYFGNWVIDHSIGFTLKWNGGEA